jgi:hypothetical protein
MSSLVELESILKKLQKIDAKYRTREFALILFEKLKKLTYCPERNKSLHI